MKKWWSSLGLVALLFVLSACSSNKAEEIILEAAKVAKERTSYEMTLINYQDIYAAALGFEMQTEIASEAQITEDPKAMHQLIQLKMNGEEESMETELYVKDNELYLRDSSAEGWRYLPSDEFEEVRVSLGIGEDPTVNYDVLEQYAKDFKVTKSEEGTHLLILNGEGDAFQKLLKDELEKSGLLGEEFFDEEGKIEGLTIHSVAFQLEVDPKTYETNSFIIKSDIEFGQGEEAIRIAQNVQVDLKNINGVKEIKVPQKIIDEAVLQEEPVEE